VSRGAELANRSIVLLRFLAPIVVTSAFVAGSASADTPERRLREHLLDEVRMGLAANMASGSHLVGVGSRERYHLVSYDLQLYITRFITRRWGINIDLTFDLPVDRESLLVRGEAGADLAIATWTGKMPGSWIVSAGVGGDLGRYWYAGRGYPYASTRLRVWPTSKISLQARYLAIPVSIGTALPTWEQRMELATSYSLFQFGLRASWVAATGGDPSRVYTQQEIGAFVALAVM